MMGKNLKISETVQKIILIFFTKDYVYKCIGLITTIAKHDIRNRKLITFDCLRWITTTCKEKYYLIHPFSSFLKYLFQFLLGRYCSFWFHFPWKELANSNTIVKYLYPAHFPVVSLVLTITSAASCKGKYLLNHAFQPFFPVSSSFFHFRWKKPISSGTV